MKTLVVLLGPTGVGKTDLSILLAKSLHASIISTDSRQIYKGLHIGVASPNTHQLSQVPHFMIGELPIEQYYSASNFEIDALKIIEEQHQKTDFVIATGGSMLYIDALCDGIDDMPSVNETLRQELWNLYEKDGLDEIRIRLKEYDPVFYEQVDLKNHKRVIHALEVCLTTGRPYSSFRTYKKKHRPFHIVKIGLSRNREDLYARINSRVDKMMNDGLLSEAKSYYSYRNLNSLNTVGYKELFKYFDGDYDLQFAVDKIKQNTRIYSRKQMTWFKKDESIHWFDMTAETSLEALVLDIRKLL